MACCWSGGGARWRVVLGCCVLVVFGVVQWMCPPWGCVAGCLVFVGWWWYAVYSLRGGRGWGGPASCCFCACVEGLPVAVGLVRLGAVWAGVSRLFGVLVLLCVVWCGVACISALGPAGGVAGLVMGSPSSFWAGGPVAVPVAVALSGTVVVLVAVVFCCP